MESSEVALKSQIIQCGKDLCDLKRAQLVPPLMLAKLQFLISLIQAEPVNENVVQLLPYYQREALESLPLQTQIKLFITTVKCLSGKEIVIYIRRQKAYLRKQKGFFGWKKCYIDCNTNYFQIHQSRKSQSPSSKMSISKLWISRFYKQYKKKTIFAIYYQNTKYVLGFEEELTCKRIHQALTSLICDNKQWQCTKYNRQSLQIENNSQKLGPESRKVEQAIISQELEYLCIVQDRLDKYDLTDNGYKLLKNIQYGRILTNQKDGFVKINLIFKNVDEISLLQNYILQTTWNKSIQSSSILSKPRTNSYICYMKTNKYSFISYPRDCFLSVVYYRPCQCRTQKDNKDNSYLLIQSIENNNQPPATGVVRMKFNQLIQIEKNQQQQNVLLMSITTQADFKGYSSTADNIAMSLHLMNDISQFAKQAEKNVKKSIFDEIVCPCKGEEIRAGGTERVLSDFSVPTDRNYTMDSKMQQRPSSFGGLKNVSDFDQIARDEELLINEIELLLNGNRNQKLLQFIKQKKHYSYALRHKFTNEDKTVTFDKAKYFTGKLFLEQGNRWRFNGDDFQFVDKQILEAQGDVLKTIIKQLGSNLLSGKSVMNMSLPVEIFDKKSMLDVIAESLGFLPYFLAKAVDQKDHIQQIKYVTCAFMFFSATCPNIQKPFNPILGQTYQGKVGDFIVSLQQISHHPPISALYIKSKDLQLYGNVEVNVDMGINSAYSKINNWFHLHIFSSNTHYKIKPPDVEVKGLVYGARTLRLAYRGYVYEKKNNLFCQVSIGKAKKRIYEVNQKLGPADLIGGIFKVKEQFGQKVMKHNQRKGFQGLAPEDVLQNHCFLSGKWYGNIFFDKVSYKSITDGPFPQKCFKLKYLLPSDSLFRQDVIYKLSEDNNNSNRQKQILENIQRQDRKLRQKYNKK